MPLKRNPKKKQEVRKVVEGKVLRTPDGTPMSLFKSAMLPAVTLNVRQFAFPKSFLVVDAKRVNIYVKNPETGWDLKDSSGHKKTTGEYAVRLQLVSGDMAQTLVDAGESLDGLKQIQCTILKDIPLQNFEMYSTLIDLVKPVVMLGFGGQQADRLVLEAEDCKFI